MSIFFRYLLALAMNMAWQRAGRGGAIPPVRLPGKGKSPVSLPMIGPWQMMAATWVLKRVWARHGTNIKSRLMNNANDLTRRAAQYIPDPKGAGAASGVTSGVASGVTSGAKPNTTSSTRSAPSATSSVTPSATPMPTPASTPRPAPNFNTQVLGGTPASNATTSTTPQSPLPQGSTLGKLRGRS